MNQEGKAKARTYRYIRAYQRDGKWERNGGDEGSSIINREVRGARFEVIAWRLETRQEEGGSDTAERIYREGKGDKGETRGRTKQ